MFVFAYQRYPNDIIFYSSKSLKNLEPLIRSALQNETYLLHDSGYLIDNLSSAIDFVTNQPIDLVMEKFRFLFKDTTFGIIQVKEMEMVKNDNIIRNAANG